MSCLLPRIRARALEFVRIDAWEALVPAAYGVLAPPHEGTPERLGDGDVAVVPGVAFDELGRRLGRGGGYYDRAFSGAGPQLIGAAFSLQVVEEVPVDSRDRVMDAIVTERGLQWLAGRA